MDSKESPGFLKGRGLSLTTVRHLKSPVSPSPQPCNAAFGSAAFGLPVSLYRSKFSDCPADAVPNSYPKLDPLWDNVMRGHGVGPALQCERKSRPVTRHATGRDTYDMPSARVTLGITER